MQSMQFLLSSLVMIVIGFVQFSACAPAGKQLNPIRINTTCASPLTTNSPTYRPPHDSTLYYYYKAIQVTVYTSGTYTFTSVSNIDVYGYLYQNNFDPLNPSLNIRARNDDGAGNLQFQFSVYLQAGSTYILVVTTFSPQVTGLCSIVITGPALAYCSDYIPTTTTSTRPPFNSAISSSSPIFYRCNGSSTSTYYYVAIRLTIHTTGTYIFISSSNIDLYGYLYSPTFDPNRPCLNILARDDDGAGTLQFQLRVSLQAGDQYTLVVTTYSPQVTGSFQIITSGPNRVDFNY